MRVAPGIRGMPAGIPRVAVALSGRRRYTRKTMRHEGAVVFPFRTELSLEPLIDFWTRAGEGDSPACAAIARLVADEVAQAPGLRGTISDLTVLEQHSDLVD